MPQYLVKQAEVNLVTYEVEAADKGTALGLFLACPDKYPERAREVTGTIPVAVVRNGGIVTPEDEVVPAAKI